jgi:hypothetical protein
LSEEARIESSLAANYKHIVTGFLIFHSRALTALRYPAHIIDLPSTDSEVKGYGPAKESARILENRSSTHDEDHA